MKQTISYKTFFRNYLIFTLIAALIFLLLVYSVKISQPRWNNNLRVTVQSVLDENEPDTWLVESAVNINNPLITSAACYDTKNKKNGEYYKSIIIRIQTLYGPVPGVFIVDKNSDVIFVGYAVFHGRIAELMHKNMNTKRIEYWKNRIPEIIKQDSKQEN